MEKVVRRAKTIEERLRWRAKGMQNSKEKRVAKERAVKEQAEAWSRQQLAQRMAREVAANVRAARERRQQAWQQGLLAPRHDFGAAAGEHYGALDPNFTRAPTRHPRNRPKVWHLAEGDRVVLLQGRDRGLIGKIESVDTESASVYVKDVELQRFRVPEFLRSELSAQGEGELEDIPETSVRGRDIPIEHVRLVAPVLLPGQETAQDAVIERVELVRIQPNGKHVVVTEARQQRMAEKLGAKCERRIVGSTITIPWPEEVEIEEKAHLDDTEADFVAEKTFTPFLYYPPIPSTVLDELRNKHSRFRTRLTDRERADQDRHERRAERREQLYETMQTPLQQQAAERLARQKDAPKKELTQAQLAVIGKAMVEEKRLRAEARQQGPSS